MASLILKYNPVFKDEDLNSILEISAGSKRPANFSLRKYDDLLTSEQVYSKNTFFDLQKKVYSQFLLLDRLHKVAYTNSIPGALRHIDAFSYSIIVQYDLLWGRMTDVIRLKNDIIRRHKLALRYFSKATREHGYIVNAENTNNIFIVLNENYPVRQGETGYVIRGDKEKIATLSFFTHREGMRAKIIKVHGKGQQLKPFDKILLQLK